MSSTTRQERTKQGTSGNNKAGEDRTGRARQSIVGQVKPSGTGIAVQGRAGQISRPGLSMAWERKAGHGMSKQGKVG